MNAATESRLNALKELGKNWDSYGADPMDPKAIEKARKLLEVIQTEPLIFPTVEGSVALCWNDEDITLTIYGDRCELYVEGLDE